MLPFADALTGDYQVFVERTPWWVNLSVLAGAGIFTVVLVLVLRRVNRKSGPQR